MRAVIQRVSQARVDIDGRTHGDIGNGLLVLMATEPTDTVADVQWLSGKIVRMRIFADDLGQMNRSALETGAEILVVSQFTLFASTKKGNRPSFTRSAKPELAIPIYNSFLTQLESDLGRAIASGEFGADMKVTLTNDGPVTIVMDTRNRE